MMIQRPACAMLLTAALTCMSAPLPADQVPLPDCDATTAENGARLTNGPDCIIAWVQNNQLLTIIWTPVQDDFEAAALIHDGAALRSSHRPQLIDVDQDGWLDLVTFAQVGMVNGNFDIFLYDPVGETFEHTGPLYGHTLERDMAGYIVVAGRSGPGTILRFFSVADGALIYRFELDPFVPDPSGSGFTCKVSAARSDTISPDEVPPSAAVPDDPALMAHYCAPETRSPDVGRATNLAEDSSAVDRVPAQTVFHCHLEGCSHAVTITQTLEGMRYTYGSVNGAAELVLDRPIDQVNVLPDNGAGPSRFGEITFANGAYEYTAYYSYELGDADNKAITGDPGSPFPNDTFTRGLVVTKDGNDAAPIFHKHCQLKNSYDAIAALWHL